MLSVIELNEMERWDAIVKSFSDYDVYYLSSYTKAFKVHGDGEPLLFYYEDDEIRGMNVVMKRDIENDKKFKGKFKSNTFFDIITPYGYGGFIIEGSLNDNNLKRLDEIYSRYCYSNNIVSEFVRFHPVLKNNSVNKNIYDVTELGKTITLDLVSPKQIWEDLSSKNRNVIRKANKSGVKVYWGRSQDLIEKFIPLYNATMDKDSAISYYYFNKEFYDSILEDLKYNSMIFYAMYENKIISMSMVLFSNNSMHYHLSASDKEYQSLAATNLLLYEAACWGYENGFNSFHLGGGLGSQEDSLYKFKKAFNRNSKTYFSIGKKIFNYEKYNQLLEVRYEDDKEIKKSTYFPQYRG